MGEPRKGRFCGGGRPKGEGEPGESTPPPPSPLLVVSGLWSVLPAVPLLLLLPPPPPRPERRELPSADAKFCAAAAPSGGEEEEASREDLEMRSSCGCMEKEDEGEKGEEVEEEPRTLEKGEEERPVMGEVMCMVSGASSWLVVAVLALN